jgi:hypothetical protein
MIMEVKNDDLWQKHDSQRISSSGIVGFGRCAHGVDWMRLSTGPHIARV